MIFFEQFKDWVIVTQHPKIVCFLHKLNKSVFTTGSVLNIMNAYNDPRFNKEADKANNYKTNTILSAPIKSIDGKNVIGVLQSVNKLNGFFTQDDEALLILMSKIVSIVLRNSQKFDETVMYHNNLRSILRVNMYFILLDRC